MTKEQQLIFSDFLEKVKNNTVTPEMVMEVLHHIPDFAKELIKLIKSTSENNKDKYLSDNDVIQKLVDPLNDVTNNKDIPSEKKEELTKVIANLINEAMKKKEKSEQLYHERFIEMMSVVKWMGLVAGAVLIAYLGGKYKSDSIGKQISV